MASRFRCSRRAIGPAIIVAWALLGAAGGARFGVGVVRERRLVRFDSTTEDWSLRWLSTPREVCRPEDPDEWMACPCAGFSFGEAGQLALVRQRHGYSDERLGLDSLFDTGVAAPGHAVLKRWPVYDSDWQQPSSPSFAARVRRRPLARVMAIADYDHDGRATEFPVRIGNAGCGHETAVLVGISRRDAHLHVFGTALHPNAPLVLQVPDWEALRRANAETTVVEYRCGDHGSDTEIAISLHAGPGGISADSLTYGCVFPAKGRGKLLSSHAF